MFIFVVVLCDKVDMDRDDDDDDDNDGVKVVACGFVIK